MKPLPELMSFLEGLSEPHILFDARYRILAANAAYRQQFSQAQSVVELELAQGKYREVRRLFESQSVSVKRLQRVQIGKIKLGELPVGKWRTLTEPEIKSLMS